MIATSILQHPLPMALCVSKGENSHGFSLLNLFSSKKELLEKSEYAIYTSIICQTLPCLPCTAAITNLTRIYLIFFKKPKQKFHFSTTLLLCGPIQRGCVCACEKDAFVPVRKTRTKAGAGGHTSAMTQQHFPCQPNSNPYVTGKRGSSCCRICHQ